MTRSKYKIFNTELLFLDIINEGQRPYFGEKCTKIIRALSLSKCKNMGAVPIKYERRKTSEVRIGKVPMGADHPIRVQSMINTATSDVNASVSQCIGIIRAGADYVRITVPSVRDVENLATIVRELRHKGFDTPVIADVHFNPDIAERAAAIVEKIRINPGNYAGSRKQNKSVSAGDEYSMGVERIKEKLIPLLDICRANNTALRIGTNHGSLSERIMDRYGDTPGGMAESAMEYLRICRQQDFSNVVISMKASNTHVMVRSTRLLVEKMIKEDMHYPLHIGVTEAGEGDDGRIKSAVGVGALLADGIGDTVRISLTEEPEEEIPVALKLVNYFSLRKSHKPIKPISTYPINPFRYEKRKSISTGNIGGKYHPVVVAGKGKEGISFKGHTAPDYLYMDNIDNDFHIPGNTGVILNAKRWKEYRGRNINFYPLFSLADYINEKERSAKINFVRIFYNELNDDVISLLRNDSTVVLVSVTDNINGFAEQRALFCELINRGCNIPVIIRRDYDEDKSEDFKLKSAADTGGLFLDGLGDGIWLTNSGNTGQEEIVRTAFGILQAARVRISWTEYISCPSCGRTNFNIKEAVARIRMRTSHLRGLKIAVMGCIVNGPGEMADADYGYVGTGKNKVTLYKERAAVKKNIPEQEAIDELIALIKENGDWKEPPQA
jgi:(E)-4-hydroxy-3-methylbut-2-enyl-diphosphate synthase